LHFFKKFEFLHFLTFFDLENQQKEDEEEDKDEPPNNNNCDNKPYYM